MNKIEILKTALEGREQELLGYQINIDNYTLAIEHIEALGDHELAEFCQQLKDRLVTEKLEQKKSKVIYDVIKQQLEE
jgi:hypothetical protein